MQGTRKLTTDGSFSSSALAAYPGNVLQAMAVLFVNCLSELKVVCWPHNLADGSKGNEASKEARKSISLYRFRPLPMVGGEGFTLFLVGILFFDYFISSPLLCLLLPPRG